MNELRCFWDEDEELFLCLDDDRVFQAGFVRVVTTGTGNVYCAEDGVTLYVAEDGATLYTPES